MPNPQPQLGLDGCRPVQNFWASLGTIADPAARGAKLVQAFLTGEPSLTAAGFNPFFRFQNFGPGKGRVRTETFGVAGVVPGWDFREFRINANGSAVELPVAQSFSPSTFGATGHAKAATCSQELLNTVGTLTPAPANFNSLGIDVAPTCFDGASGNFGNAAGRPRSEPAGVCGTARGPGQSDRPRSEPHRHADRGADDVRRDLHRLPLPPRRAAVSRSRTGADSAGRHAAARRIHRRRQLHHGE